MVPPRAVLPCPAAPYPRAASGSSQFEALETEFELLRDAFGALVVARHRGEDVSGIERAPARVAWRSGRASLHMTAPLRASGRSSNSMASALTWMDEMEPVDGLVETGTVPAEDLDVAELRRRTFQRFGEAAGAVQVGSQTWMGPLAEPARHRTGPGPPACGVRRDGADLADGRRRRWSPSSPYRTLLRSSAARWARDGSPVEAAATALGLAPGSIETTLRDVLAAWRAVLDRGLIEPWDYRFATGALDRRLGGRVSHEQAAEHQRRAGVSAIFVRESDCPRDRIRRGPAARAPADPDRVHDRARLRSGRRRWRLDPGNAVGVRDVRGGRDRQPGGAAPRERACAPRGGDPRPSPALFEPLVADGGLVEAFADLLGWDVHEAAFQARYLGDAADARECRLGRYGRVMLDVRRALFEVELHRDPERSRTRCGPN